MNLGTTSLLMTMLIHYLTLFTLFNNGKHLRNIDGKLSNNNHDCKLIQYQFFNVADELIANSASDNSGTVKNNNLVNYLFQTFKHPFTNIKFNYTSNL